MTNIDLIADLRDLRRSARPAWQKPALFVALVLTASIAFAAGAIADALAPTKRR